jgi:hypothetical protein
MQNQYTGGHYTSVAYNPSDRSWYSFDDSTVEKFTGEPNTQGAYLCFYRLQGDGRSSDTNRLQTPRAGNFSVKLHQLPEPVRGDALRGSRAGKKTEKKNFCEYSGDESSSSWCEEGEEGEEDRDALPESNDVSRFCLSSSGFLHCKLDNSEPADAVDFRGLAEGYVSRDPQNVTQQIAWFGQQCLTSDDAYRFREKTMLSDNVVNYFLSFLEDQNNSPANYCFGGKPCYVVSSFFYVKLFSNKKKYNYMAVKRWSRRAKVKLGVYTQDYSE